MGSSVGSCKLCGQTASLCRSHIVPELAYEPIKNAKGQMYSVGSKVLKVQVGHRERLLCHQCEGIVSRYETKFKNCWMDTIPSHFSRLSTSHEFVSVAITDFDSFKLFHMSVFWRAAISMGFKIGSISFGPYEDRIARMIKTGDPGNAGEFPLFAVVNLDSQGRPVPTMSQIAQGEGRFVRRYHYYVMSYAFCDWTFVLACPGTSWMRDLEMQWRQGQEFILMTSPHNESKPFKLMADILRRQSHS